MDLISRQGAIDALDIGAELLRRALDDMDLVGVEREKFEWGLGLIESCISDMKELPSVQPEIIHCRDCKHYVAHSLFGRSQGWCERLCDEFDKSLARGTEPDDYCSRAEPYKGEQE